MHLESYTDRDGKLRHFRVHHTFGDQEMVRPAYIARAVETWALANRHAMTGQHPASLAFLEAWNALTSAEIAQVPAYMALNPWGAPRPDGE